MELFWLVPIVFGVLVVVLGVIVLAVLIPAARRQVEIDRARSADEERDPGAR
jgi:hypothetical protein